MLETGRHLRNLWHCLHIFLLGVAENSIPLQGVVSRSRKYPCTLQRQQKSSLVLCHKGRKYASRGRMWPLVRVLSAPCRACSWVAALYLIRRCRGYHYTERSWAILSSPSNHCTLSFCSEQCKINCSGFMSSNFSSEW